METSLAEFLYKLSMSSEILAEWTRFKSDIEHFENIPHISRYIYPISQMITYITNANTGFWLYIYIVYMINGQESLYFESFYIYVKVT